MKYLILFQEAIDFAASEFQDSMTSTVSGGQTSRIISWNAIRNIFSEVKLFVL